MELWAKVGAISGSMILNVELELPRGEDAVVFAEKAEEETDEELL